MQGSWRCDHYASPGMENEGMHVRLTKRTLPLPCPPTHPCPQLLACLRVIVATEGELQQVRQHQADPLAGPLNSENEEQALRTLCAALQGMLEPLQCLPLLARGGGKAAAAADDRGSEDAAAAAAAVGEALAEQQLGQLHLQQAAAAQPVAAGDGAAGPRQQQQQLAGEEQQAGGEEQQPGCNENGFDADWRMSRHFCWVYLEGQVAILQRSLEECGRLLGLLGEGAS